MANRRYRTRPASPDDAPPIVALVTACFREYASFAPPGWQPPTGRGAEERVRAGLGTPGAEGEIAFDHDDLHAGHVLWLPASKTARARSPDPSLAHLWQLFLEPEHRGHGLGRQLLAMAIQRAGAAGFASMRLFTPAGHDRARRFYERDGWTLVGDREVDPELRLPIVEYRRSLEVRSRQNDPS